MRKGKPICGTFGCKVTPDGSLQVFNKPFVFSGERVSAIKDTVRINAIRGLVGELIALPEPCCNGGGDCESRLVFAGAYQKGGGYSIIARYLRDDGEKHPLSEHDVTVCAYGTDEIGEDGKLYHYYPSLSGECCYGLENVNSMDELHKTNPVYQAFKKRYDNITCYNHEYMFWEDQSFLFDDYEGPAEEDSELIEEFLGEILSDF